MGTSKNSKIKACDFGQDIKIYAIMMINMA